MRRLFSISAIAALVFQVMSPLVAAACPHTKQMPACHRVEQAAKGHRHCDGMTSQKAEEAAPDPDTPSLKAAESSGSCPMDCCGASIVTNAAVLPSSTSLPSLVTTDRSRLMVSVPFVNAGFSSHTDRGPPTA